MMANQIRARRSDPKATLPKLYLKSHPSPLLISRLLDLREWFLQEWSASTSVGSGGKVPDADCYDDNELCTRYDHGDHPEQGEEEIDHVVSQIVVPISRLSNAKFTYQTSSRYWVPPVTATTSPEEERYAASTTQKAMKRAVKIKAPVGTKMVRRFWLMKTADVFMTAVAILILL